VTRLIAVVGAGPAGCAAAVQCARLGAPVRLFDRAGRAGGLIANGFLVENYPGLEGPVPGPVFADRLGQHLKRFGVEVEQMELTGVEPDGASWVLHLGRTPVRCQSAIIAIGTEPRPFAVAGDPALVARSVFHEVGQLMRAHGSLRQVVVVGGGEAAFDYSLTLAAAGAEVVIAVRGAAARARGRLVEQVAAEQAIRVALETRVTELAEHDGSLRVTAVTGADRHRLPADAILAAVGRASAAWDIVGSTVAGDHVGALTPRPGLFICGDARSGALGQAGIAVGDGLRAAAMAVARLAEESR
jgi:thioredoxin reductase (NADPH)